MENPASWETLFRRTSRSRLTPAFLRAPKNCSADFLVKPIDGLELLVRVERLLRLRAQSELVYAERDRLLKELSKVRASLSALGEPAALTALAAASTEELLHEQRRLLGEALRSEGCARNDELRGRLEEILRVSEEIERRVGTSATAFPLSQTRSTV